MTNTEIILAEAAATNTDLAEHLDRAHARIKELLTERAELSALAGQLCRVLCPACKEG